LLEYLPANILLLESTEKMAMPKATATSTAARRDCPADSQEKTQENIWVGVRIRPQSAKELGEQVAVRQISDQVIEQGETLDLRVSTNIRYAASHHRVVNNAASTGEPESGARFKYDRVFDESCTNKEVYKEVARQIVLSGMEGKNGTVFAYGQTASGKTHTMRAMVEEGSREIFDYIEGAHEREFMVRVSSLEIYNEVNNRR
jgi:chromosomal replication initiation ATPase DnaA